MFIYKLTLWQQTIWTLGSLCKMSEVKCVSCSSHLHVWLSTYALLFLSHSKYDLCCGRVLIGLALPCVCIGVCLYLGTNVCVCICQHVDSVSGVRSPLCGPAHASLLQSEWLFPLLLTRALRLSVAPLDSGRPRLHGASCLLQHTGHSVFRTIALGNDSKSRFIDFS